MIGKLINDGGHSVFIQREDFLESISLLWSLMETPSVSLELPSIYSRFISGNTRLNLKSDEWVFEGYLESKDLDFQRNTIKVSFVHIVNKLSKRTLPTNITLKDKSVKEVITHTWGHWQSEETHDEFVNKFTVDYLDQYAELYKIEYEFSNETIIDFLTKICEKTPELYWRVDREDPYTIEVGVFGKYREILISETNKLVALTGVSEDYSDVTNVAVVMSDKSDSGASSLTLRDIFYNPPLMLDGFPVIKTGNKVNSQRHYQYPQIPQFAPEIIGEEFAILDEEGVALEAGQLLWGTITENDTQAIAEDNKEITNTDRLNATIQLYKSAIRKLKNSRKKVFYDITVEPLGQKLHAGDKVMFLLEQGVVTLLPCTKYYEKVLKENNWFYIIELEDLYLEGDAYLQKIRLSKFIHSERDITATT